MSYSHNFNQTKQMKHKPCNIEDKLKEYRSQKQAEVKLSFPKSIWERFFGKLKIPNENIDAANVFDYHTQSLKVNHAEEQELKSSSSQRKEIAENLNFRKKAQSNEAVVPKQVLLCTPASPVHNDTTHVLEISNSDGEFKWFIFFLKIILWIVLFLLCLELECGAIYIIFSAFYLIFTNFRNGQRKPGEPSAYSVFNPECEAIDGTLKPEQFEKEIRYGF